MGSEWEETSLKAVADFRNGAGVKQVHFAENGTPLARVSDFTSDSIDLSDTKFVESNHAKSWKSHFIQVDDVIVATVGSWPPNWSSIVGKVVRAPKDAVGAIQNQNTCCVQPDTRKLDNRFLFYRLKQKDFAWHAANNAGGSANQARLPVKKLGTFSLRLPPLLEQKAIAHVLGSLDDKIELNRRMNETLEGMAQALFKSWFVDFDPVIDNALAAGNPIPEPLAQRAETRRQTIANGTANRESAQAFPASFRFTEELGWIPEGWEADTIGKLLEVTDFVANGSFALLKANVTLSDEPDYALYVRTTDYKNGFSLSKAKYTTKSSYDYLEKSRLFGDEIIISNVGDTGTVFRPPAWRGKPMTLGSNSIALKTAHDCHFFYEYFRSDFGQHQISGIVGGSAQPKFNKTDFRSLQLFLPPSKIRHAFSVNVEGIWERHITGLKNNETITILRDTLLPKLISGELRIPQAEKMVEEAIA